VVYLRTSLNNGDWITLDSSGKGWFQGSFKLPKLARKRQTLAFQALDKNETLLAKREVSFLTEVLPEHLTIAPSSDKKNLSFRVTVQDGQQKPIAGRKVDYGCFDPVRFGENQGTAVTDVIAFSCLPISPAPTQFIYVAAGTNSPERARTSDLRIFQLGK